MTDYPVPVETEQNRYIRVDPAQEELSPQALADELSRLHARCRNDAGPGLTERLGRMLGLADGANSIECLLVSPGDTATIHYYFGVVEDDQNTINALERALHLLLPDSYEMQQVEGVLEQRSDVLVLGDRAHHRQTYSKVVGVEFRGVSQRRADWQTALKSFDKAEHTQQQSRTGAVDSDDTDAADSPSPLSYLIETMADSQLPMVYQALLTPLPNWTRAANKRTEALKNRMDRHRDAVVTTMIRDDDAVEIGEADRRRLEQIRARNKTNSFGVNARLAVLAPNADDTRARHLAEESRSAFAHVSGDFHEISGQILTEDAGEQLLADLCQQTTYVKNYERPATMLPLTSNESRAIVADPREVPHFMAVDGASLPPDARRALETTPPDQTAMPRPPESVLETFRGEGMALGYALDSHGKPTDRISLPPDRQTEHLAIVGGTGAGKSTMLLSAMLANRTATGGANIVIDPKGGRFVEEYLRCHYAATGSLEDVYYFDLAEWLPAFSFFDVRDELAAGVPRAVATEDRISHYEEVLRQVTGKENYEAAIRSPDLITDTLKLLYDPDHGADAFRHRALQETLTTLSTDGTIPAVSDEDLARRLRGLVETDDPRSFEKVKQGALTRIGKISGRTHLNRIFNYDPDADRQFDLADHLNDDVTIIFDTGRLREQVQRGVAIVILSQLWTALRRRHRRNASENQPLVNLYLEEAPSIAESELLETFLSKGREFNVGVTLAMQFPAQMEAADEQTYNELLNDVGTYVTGRVTNDEGVARRFATAAMGASEVANRLGSLSRGQWLVDLPGEFFAQKSEPFALRSLPLPTGHPDKQATPPAGYTDAADTMVRHTLTTAGVTMERSHHDTATDAEPPADEESPPASSQEPSIFELSDRLPDCVTYDTAQNSLRCHSCGRLYAPVTAGMRRAIECCHELQAVDRDDIPVCSYHLRLSPEDIDAMDWTLRQLAFLQVVHNAQQKRYEPMEYDIVHDSMIRLKEYVGIEQEAIRELTDADLLTHDGDHPHRLYSVTGAGRTLLNEQYRRGIDFGHLKGDLGESSQHVCGVEAARRYFVRAYAENPDSPVATIKPYYELDGDTIDAAAFMRGATEDPADTYNRRVLDIAGLDADGEIILTCEVERINNDYRSAIPKDYDTMAACEPAEAHWVVLKQAAGHTVLEALQSPAEGSPRIEHSYSDSTPPHQFRIDAPGLTDIYSISRLRNRL